MRPIKLVKYTLFLILTSNLMLYGMSGDRSGIRPGIPSGPYMHGLPPLAEEVYIDPETAQVLDTIAQEWQQKQEAQEKGKEEAEERSAKRRKIEKEVDASEQPQPREAQFSSTTTTTTTTTYMQPAQASSQATVWEESEWEDVLRAVNQRIAREDAEEQEEWFRGLLPHIEETLFNREPNLINVIAQRFFEREITLDELNKDTISRSPFTVRLRVVAGRKRRITQEQIQLIGQMFPNLRELELTGVELKDLGLKILSEQQIAHTLRRLDVSFNDLTAVWFTIGAIDNFTNLRSLSIAGNYNYNKNKNKIGDAGLEAIARAPFAANLTELNVRDNDITDEGVQASMAAFTSLRSLDIQGNEIYDGGFEAIAQAPFAGNLIQLDFGTNTIGSEVIQANIAAFTSLRSLSITENEICGELEALAQAPFAPNLTELNLSYNNITDEVLQANIAAFTSLRSLNIGNNDIGKAGLEAIARAPFAANLTELNLSHNNITDEGIQANIAAFTNLRSLIANYNRIDDSGLAAIAQAPFAANLTELNVRDNSISDEGVQANIAAFTSLRNLNIANNDIGNAGLEAIAQAPCAANLTELNVRDNDITDEGVQANIAAFTSLRNLNIANNKIGDAALEAIAQAPCAANLTELNIGHTDITAEGIAANRRVFISLTSLDDSGI